MCDYPPMYERFRDAIKRLDEISIEEFKRINIELGIHNEDGTLTERYSQPKKKKKKK